MDWKPRAGVDRIWVSRRDPTPEGAGATQDGLLTAQPYPFLACIQFADVESAKLHPPALLDVSGERLCMRQVFRNIASSEYPNLDLPALNPLCRNPLVRYLRVGSPPPSAGYQYWRLSDGVRLLVGPAAKTMSTQNRR